METHPPITVRVVLNALDALCPPSRTLAAGLEVLKSNTTSLRTSASIEARPLHTSLRRDIHSAPRGSAGNMYSRCNCLFVAAAATAAAAVGAGVVEVLRNGNFESRL